MTSYPAALTKRYHRLIKAKPVADSQERYYLDLYFNLSLDQQYHLLSIVDKLIQRFETRAKERSTRQQMGEVSGLVLCFRLGEYLAMQGRGDIQFIDLLNWHFKCDMSSDKWQSLLGIKHHGVYDLR